jgi:uncharacterized protein YndB with AHSA1/START domain
MPSFHDTATSSGPPEEVWKLLYDPARFPDWWAGIGTVDVKNDGEYTMYPEGYPDFPMAQLLDTQRGQQRVTVSCLVSDLRFEWRLEPDRDGTRITVDVEIPENEAHRLDTQREVISASVRRLAEIAAVAWNPATSAVSEQSGRGWRRVSPSHRGEPGTSRTARRSAGKRFRTHKNPTLFSLATRLSLLPSKPRASPSCAALDETRQSAKRHRLLLRRCSRVSRAVEIVIVLGARRSLRQE